MVPRVQLGSSDLMIACACDRSGLVHMACCRFICVLAVLATFQRHPYSFKILVDLNDFTPAELAKVPDALPTVNGTWAIVANTIPQPADTVWRAAFKHLGEAQTVSEDNPMSFTQCKAVSRILGAPPSMAFGYHETGGEPYTQLNHTEISQYHEQCKTQVCLLTRAFWPSSPWRTRVEAVLSHPNLGGVAMEYGPGENGKRTEEDFVREMLAAKKKAIFLWPLQPSGNQTCEGNVGDAIRSFVARGMDMANDDVWIVIARYSLPKPCTDCVYGETNSLLAAVREALRLQTFIKSADTPSYLI